MNAELYYEVFNVRIHLEGLGEYGRIKLKLKFKNYAVMVGLSSRSAALGQDPVLFLWSRWKFGDPYRGSNLVITLHFLL
jgi:hypothetical protein